MLRYVTAAVGLPVAVGIALVEAALVPVAVVGRAAARAPSYLPELGAFRTGRRPRRAAGPPASKRGEAADSPHAPLDTAPPEAVSATFGIGQALAKTVTFRAIVTTLDFTTNYLVLGEFATAAGLSTLNLVGGPLFYFAHETVWNYLGPSGATVDVALPERVEADMPAPVTGWQGFTVSRALAKTVTYRAVATVVDFTTNYVVVGDAVTAAGLAAFGFFLGPFVYFGHERVWEYLSAPKDAEREPAATPMLPGPALAAAGRA